jgi:hypothetical protein
MKRINQVALSVCALLAAGAVIDGLCNTAIFTRPSSAIVGRPLTPVSVAGVARRTTRRMIYATSVYVATLPVGCTTVIIEGTSLYQCGATYYQSSGNQYVVVNVN